MNNSAYWLRRWPAIHRIGRWFRRAIGDALQEAFWEFARQFFAGSKRHGPPARTFSVYQALRADWPKINGRIVLHDQGVPVVTEDSLLVRCGLNQYGDQPWPVLWSEHVNARLVTESLALLSPDKELCVESAYNERFWRFDPASRFLRLPPPVRLAGNWTSLMSRWVPNGGVPIYGHWLHEALPRLALLPEFPPDTKILVPAKLGPAQKESLQMLGLWDRCRHTPERHVMVERYFFSSLTSNIDCYNPYALHRVREALLPKRDPNYSGPRKFFLQRTAKKRPVENLAEVCDFFRRQGWAVVRDLDLTLAQTIKLFSEAEAICSNLGSNMSNVIFCQPGCRVMHLVPDIFLDGWIDWIAQELKLDYHFAVFPTGGPLTPRIRIDLKQLEEFYHAVNSAAPGKAAPASRLLFQ